MWRGFLLKILFLKIRVFMLNHFKSTHKLVVDAFIIIVKLGRTNVFELLMQGCGWLDGVDSVLLHLPSSRPRVKYSRIPARYLESRARGLKLSPTQ